MSDRKLSNVPIWLWIVIISVIGFLALALYHIFSRKEEDPKTKGIEMKIAGTFLLINSSILFIQNVGLFFGMDLMQAYPCLVNLSSFYVPLNGIGAGIIALRSR